MKRTILIYTIGSYWFNIIHGRSQGLVELGSADVKGRVNLDDRGNVRFLFISVLLKNPWKCGGLVLGGWALCKQFLRLLLRVGTCGYAQVPEVSRQCKVCSLMVQYGWRVAGCLLMLDRRGGVKSW